MVPAFRFAFSRRSISKVAFIFLLVDYGALFLQGRFFMGGRHKSGIQALSFLYDSRHEFVDTL